MGYEAAAAVAARGQLLRGEEKGGAMRSRHGQLVTEKKAAKRCGALWMIRRVLPLSHSGSGKK